jgi:hemoglobin
MNNIIKDIENEKDIKLMVDEFYSKINVHPELSPFFNEIAKTDWNHHLPRMYDFWSSILLGTMKYSGAPFPKHQVLPLRKENFDQWLELFFHTVDENFKGPKADEAKVRASIIAKTFIYKLGLTQ